MAIQAGEIGKKLVWDTGGFNVTGLTIQLKVIDFQGITYNFTGSVDGGGLTASYVLASGANLPNPGEAKFYWRAYSGTSLVLKGAQITRTIGPSP